MKITKKKIMISVLNTIFVIAIGLWIYMTPKVIIIKESFQFEYGELIELSANEVLKVSNDKIYETVKIDLLNLDFKDGNNYPSVGNYKAQVSYVISGKLYLKDIFINIVDTVPPEFTKFIDVFEIEKGSNNSNYLTYFEVADLNEKVIAIDDTNVNYNVVGDYKIMVSATDVYENKISREAIIKIVERKTSGSNDPYYVNGILVVNKKHPLAYNYAPGENPTAGNAIRTLIADMQSLGLSVRNSYSGYRSYSSQAIIYQDYVNLYGKTQADTFSARAGYSEHQTGLAFDLKNGKGSLIQSGTPEANWLAKNAHNYGFIVRYLQGEQAITGYTYEPWHLRFIGNEATSIYNSGKTLEEYLGIQGGGYIE